MNPKTKNMPVRFQVMTVSQRAMEAAETYLQEQNSDRPITMGAAAGTYGVGVASVRSAKKVLTSPRAAKFFPNLPDYVKEGYISVRGAAAMCGHTTPKRKTDGQHFREYLVDMAEGKCPHCGAEITPASMHKDHIFPLAQGGEDKWLNLQALCPPCNEKKNSDFTDADAEALFGEAVRKKRETDTGKR